jgi:transcriptional regulator with XRE-family HTH domain
VSRETLAHKAGISTGAYRRIETCMAATGWATVIRLAEALGVSLVELARPVEARDKR